ncbi:polysaccharide deacetylase family protein [Rhizobium oryzicola]|uniref:Chitooligosaccharide deacetylase n=1 Tax=Rhizobium oryzicola TaxID=1232668 RepID=A0ABT8T3C2_9HYPH|nr:polysaccharide deacetylase family protein [Rhizobium oryzicola]MDO1585254.1 polysaccharide deacetylase family protein [Rhizobium oryzicola]
MSDFARSRLGLTGSVFAAVARWLDALRGSTGCFFTFHRGAPGEIWSGLPNRNFYLDLAFLDSLLSHLKASGRNIVTVEEGRRLAADSTTSEQFVNFSIDDCYRDTYELVLPVFRRHGVPVTLFVTTGIPDATLPLYWAGLEDILRSQDTIVLGGKVIDIRAMDQKAWAYQALQTLWDGPMLDAHYRHFCSENGIDEEQIFMRHAITWDMLSELARDPLVEIGSHTVAHRRISTLSPEAAWHEMADSRQRLREKLGVPANHFAFPYGRMNDCGPRDFAIAREVGYESAGTTTKGLLRAGPVPYAYPRITLNGAHRNILVPEFHLSGASSIAAKVLGRV